MLREETVRHYVLFVVAAQAWLRMERKGFDLTKFNEQATAEARRLLSTVPYDELCNIIKGQIMVVHNAVIPGIGKLAITKELANDDYDRFGDLLAHIEREDFARLHGEAK